MEKKEISVIQIGSSCFEDPNVLGTLASVEKRMIVFPQAKHKIAQISDLLGIKQTYYENGRKIVTDLGARIEVFSLDQLCGLFATRIINLGRNANILGSFDEFIKAESYGGIRGSTGTVSKIDYSSYEDYDSLFSQPPNPDNLLLVVPPTATDTFPLDPESPRITVDHDDVVGFTATEFSKRGFDTTLVMVTDVDGVLDASGKLLPTLNADTYRKVRGWEVLGGMVPKLDEAIKAYDQGVRVLICSSGNFASAFSNHFIGTEVVE